MTAHAKFKVRNGKMFITPFSVSDSTLRAFGATKPRKGSSEWGFTSRYADIELMAKRGIIVEPQHGDLETTGWVTEQQRMLKLADFLQFAIDIKKEAPADSWNVLFPHQKVGSSFMVSFKRGILSLTPGLGKTNTAVVGCEIVKAKKILVVVPLTLLATWEKEIVLWSSSDGSDVSRQKGAYKKNDSVRWCITNIDSVSRNLDSWMSEDWDVIIGDESILYKNWKTNRSKAMAEMSRVTKYMWLLSGNPVAKYSDDLYSQLRILYPDNFTSYWRFAQTWCLIENTPWGDKVAGNYDPEGLRHYLRDILITRTPEQAFDPRLELKIKFPDLMLEPVYVDMSKDQLAIIKELEVEAAVAKDNGDVISITAAIAMLTRVQQIVSAPINLGIDKPSIKSQTALELLDTVDLPAIVWFQFRAGLEAFAKLAEAKGHRVGIIHGGIADNKRFESVDKFQNGELDVICIQLDTGKYGLSITAAKSVIYHDRNMSLDAWMQSTHRVRRLSSTWEASGYVIHGGYTDFLIDRIIREKIGSLGQLKMTDIMEATFKTTSRTLPMGISKTHSPATRAAKKPARQVRQKVVEPSI